MIMHAVKYKMDNKEAQYLFSSIDEARAKFNSIKSNKQYKKVRLTKVIL